jgi:hypothetical protein
MFGTNRVLHIYDCSDYLIAATAAARRNIMGENTYPVAVNGINDLTEALDKLRDGDHEFRRALFETHGSPGTIYFGGEPINAKTWKTSFAGRGYERIFPYYLCKILFNGCRVAEDGKNEKGWDFLDAAGSVFLKIGGGVTMAQTGVGHPIILTGHIRHSGDDSAFYSTWAPGGTFLGHEVE